MVKITTESVFELWASAKTKLQKHMASQEDKDQEKFVVYFFFFSLVRLSRKVKRQVICRTRTLLYEIAFSVDKSGLLLLLTTIFCQNVKKSRVKLKFI